MDLSMIALFPPCKGAAMTMSLRAFYDRRDDLGPSPGTGTDFTESLAE